MKNYVQPGKVLTLVAPSGGVVSGTGYKIGSIIAIATHNADQTLPFEGVVAGVHKVAKVTSQAWTQGALLYYVSATKNFSTSSGGNTLAGVAERAAGTNDTTGYIRLNGAFVA